MAGLDALRTLGCKMSPSLDVVIVNWNSGAQLRECLESLVASRKASFRLSRVVVVDNASTDGSIYGVTDLGLPVTIIANILNRGFAAACNQGAMGSEADYLLFLNPDTRLFEESLTKPLVFMEQPSSQNIGIAGIQLIDDRGLVSRSCARFPTARVFIAKMFGLERLLPGLFPSHFMIEWDHSWSREVDQVMGSFFLVRRLLFKRLGGFDQRFFVYFEEVDFSLCARQAGWGSYYVSETRAYHKGGSSSEDIKAMRLFYSLRSRVRYGYKHFGRWSATSLLLGTLLVEPLSRLLLGIRHRSGREVKETLGGFARLWGCLPRLLG
jgi:N-acetylglucosaminyl-diphospho-decaprenol L-rhamnosyltransferase